MTLSELIVAAVALVAGACCGAFALRMRLQGELIRAQERSHAAQLRFDELQRRYEDADGKRLGAERASGELANEAAALRATLAETSQKQQHVVEALLERVKNELRDTTAARASERVGELVAPMAQKLAEFDAFVREIENKRNEDTGGLKEQISSLLSRAEKLELATAALSTQTSTLVTALRSPSTRGKWGELQLRNVVERAGMLQHCDFDEQQTVAFETGNARPDMTIRLPGNRRVFVDAKTPIDAMQAAFEAADESVRRDLQQKQARALQDHVDILSKRNYHSADGSADFVIMFVPGEAFLGAALNESPQLLEYALERGVLVTGPLALISLLRCFAMGWQVVKQEENAKRIASIGRELYERTTKFAERLIAVGRNLERTVGSFNETVASYEARLLPQGRKLKDEAALSSEDMPELSSIDIVPRPITALDAKRPQKLADDAV